MSSTTTNKKKAPGSSKTSSAKRSTSPKRPTSPKRDASPKRLEHASPKSVVTLADMKKAVDDLFHLSNYADDAKFEAAVRVCIPGEFILICSQDDRTQAQVSFPSCCRGFALNFLLYWFLAILKKGAHSSSAQLKYSHPLFLFIPPQKPQHRKITLLWITTTWRFQNMSKRQMLAV